MTHDWHSFDSELGYEVRRLDDGTYELRDANGVTTPLTEEEFEQLRSEGAKPKGLS